MSSIKRILVTGGAGFLGSHLCDRFVAEGHDVICLDNFFTSQKSNVTHLLNKPNFELIRHDIVHEIFLEVDEIYKSKPTPIDIAVNVGRAAKVDRAIAGDIAVLLLSAVIPK